MPKTYAVADQQVHDLAAEIIERHYDGLSRQGVTYQVVLVRAARDQNGDPKGHALTHGGYPALGKVRVNSLEKRVEGLPDFTVYLDADAWDESNPTRQRSLLHHEIHHVTLGEGDDDAGRPKLVLRKHDVQLGIFTEMIPLYKDQGVDTQAVVLANEALKLVQDVFKFWG